MSIFDKLFGRQPKLIALSETLNGYPKGPIPNNWEKRKLSDNCAILCPSEWYIE